MLVRETLQASGTGRKERDTGEVHRANARLTSPGELLLSHFPGRNWDRCTAARGFTTPGCTEWCCLVRGSQLISLVAVVGSADTLASGRFNNIFSSPV